MAGTSRLNIGFERSQLSVKKKGEATSAKHRYYIYGNTFLFNYLHPGRAFF